MIQSRPSTPRRRAFTLIEAVAIVIVLGVCIPPTVMFLEQSNSRRVDAVQSVRATAFATGVLEAILADVASTAPGLGFPALADSAAYLNNPGGLASRLTDLAAHYAAFGMTYEVAIGPVVGPQGTATGGPSDLFRIVTVTISYNDAAGTNIRMPISTLVGGI